MITHPPHSPPPANFIQAAFTHSSPAKTPDGGLNLSGAALTPSPMHYPSRDIALAPHPGVTAGLAPTTLPGRTPKPAARFAGIQPRRRSPCGSSAPVPHLTSPAGSRAHFTRRAHVNFFTGRTEMFPLFVWRCPARCPPQPAPGYPAPPPPRRPVPQGAPADEDPLRPLPPAELPGFPARRLPGGATGGREGGPCACRRRGAPRPARPRRARGGKAGWGRGGAGRVAASGAVPGGSPWRPGLAGCGCPSCSRRGTWIKGSSGTWQGQTTSSSSAPTETGCSSPASPATVSSGEGARSHPLPLPPPPLSMAAAAPAARNSPGSARLPSGARTHAQGGTRGAAAARAGRTASLRHAGAWRAPAPSLSLANHRAGGAVARHGPPRGALLSKRSGAGWRRLVRAPPSSPLRSPAAAAGGQLPTPGGRTDGLAPAPSCAHVLGTALSPGLRVRGAPWAGGAAAGGGRGRGAGEQGLGAALAVFAALLGP